MKHLYCILISSLIFISSYAQTNDVQTTHYLFPEFTQGVILMKTGAKNKASLNYNLWSEEMIFENKGKKLAIAKTDLGRIDTVFIEDRKFIALNTGFIELVYHSKWYLYVQHKCKIKEVGQNSGYGGTSQTSAIKSYGSVMSAGSMYELELSDDYEIEPNSCYWLKKNGDLKKFISMVELKKLYKPKKDLFKAYVKKHNVDYDNQESIIQLIDYLESN